MKKRIAILVAVLTLSVLSLKAQNFVHPVDTLEGRVPFCYYFPYWYDECPRFQWDSITFQLYNINLHPYLVLPEQYLHEKVITEHYALQPLTVKGALVMVSIDPNSYAPIIDSMSRAPEWVTLSQGDTLLPDDLYPDYFFPRHMVAEDSSRWDTARVHLLKLPKNANAILTGADSLFFYCYAYEAYFPQPVVVHDTFYLTGSFYSLKWDTSGYEHFTTSYALVGNTSIECDRCPHTRVFMGECCPIMGLYSYQRSTVGPFLPIVTMYNLNVSADYGGNVEGGGRYPAGWTIDVSAMPQPGYEFSHWSDGVMDNPRSITMNGDVTLVAVFLARGEE